MFSVNQHIYLQTGAYAYTGLFNFGSLRLPRFTLFRFSACLLAEWILYSVDRCCRMRSENISLLNELLELSLKRINRRNGWVLCIIFTITIKFKPRTNRSYQNYKIKIKFLSYSFIRIRYAFHTQSLLVNERTATQTDLLINGCKTLSTKVRVATQFCFSIPSGLQGGVRFS